MSSDPSSELVRSAVSFLQDPKVASAPLTTRLSFLTSKGLSDAQVEEALRLAAASLSTTTTSTTSYESSGGAGGEASSSGAVLPAGSSSYGPALGGGGLGTAGGQMGARYGSLLMQQQQQAPPRPSRDWRDYFVMAVISGGVMYAVSQLFKRYILPHLLPPPLPVFTATSASLQSQFDTLLSSLSQLQNSTQELKDSLEDERQRVRGLVEEVERTLESVRKREAEERDWREGVMGEVEGLKEGLPKMLSTHTTLLRSNLNTLQTELSTLKPLIQSSSASNPSASSTASSNPSPYSPRLSSIGGYGRPIGGGGAPSIPSWQQLPSSSSSGSVGGTPKGDESEGSKGLDGKGREEEKKVDGEQDGSS